MESDKQYLKSPRKRSVKENGSYVTSQTMKGGLDNFTLEKLAFVLTSRKSYSIVAISILWYRKDKRDVVIVWNDIRSVVQCSTRYHCAHIRSVLPACMRMCAYVCVFVCVWFFRGGVTLGNACGSLVLGKRVHHREGEIVFVQILAPYLGDLVVVGNLLVDLYFLVFLHHLLHGQAIQYFKKSSPSYREKRDAAGGGTRSENKSPYPS